LGKFMPKITNFGDFCSVSPILRVRTVTFGVSVRTLDTLPALNFVINRSEGFVPWGKFCTKKIEIFETFTYLSLYLYTDNVKISLKRTDRLRNLSKKQIFVKIAQGACRYCIAFVM